MHLRVMTGAHLNGPGVGVEWVDVVVMDKAAAPACSVPEEDANGAVIARQSAPTGGVVDRSV
jgi:hypothetical protein